MKNRLPLIFLVSLLALQSYAQNCGADILHKLRFDTDSAYHNAALASQQTAREARQRYQMAKTIGAYYNMQAATFTIPVVVHLLHTGGAIGTNYNPTDALVEDGIAYLNSVYGGTMPGIEGVGDINIQFVLATRDPNGNATNGIDRRNFAGVAGYTSYGVRLQGANGVPDGILKNLAKWDPSLYYNIYVVNKIDGEDGSSGQPYVGGYAQYPGLSQPTDGAVMVFHQMAPNTKTLAHELGHALGLAHPFNSSDPSGVACPPDSDLGNTGDRIADTDPISIPAFVARTGTNPCTNAPVRNYHINTEHNFMNYTDVFTLFTPDQRDVMQSSMSFPTRASLQASWAKRTTYPYAFTSPVASCTPTTSGTGTGATYAGVIGVTISDRNFSSSTTPLDTGYLNKSASPLHLIPLALEAGYPISTVLLTQLNYHQVAIWIDYNNNGVFGAGEQILYANNVPSNGGLTGVGTSFVVPASAVSNTVLRMRVINELGTIHDPGLAITTGCYNPTYGQAEDYPVFISSILPVSWKYFRGQKNGDNSWLQWATNAGAGNKYFDVERSADGANYEKIGTVANGASGIYSFVDSKATQPLYFYRLRQVDQNDKATYSSVIIIRNETAVDEQGLRASNPFKNTIDISLQKAFTATAQVELIDMNGRRLLERTLQAGQLVMKLETVGKLPSGIYLLKLRSGNTVITKKLVK